MSSDSHPCSRSVREFHHENWFDWPESIFVFGSNEAGRHGKGAARFAVQHCGAKYGQPQGLQGKAFAIPTKDKYLAPLTLAQVRNNVEFFLNIARTNPHLTFFVTRVGCGLAGFKDRDIGPMFRTAPHNCVLPAAWSIYVGPA